MSLSKRRISLKAYSKQIGANAKYAARLNEPPRHSPDPATSGTCTAPVSLERALRERRAGKGKGNQREQAQAKNAIKFLISIVILFSYLVKKELKITQMTFYCLLYQN